MREDQSELGNALDSRSHDHARSRAYRWGEDGLAGIRDDRQRLCFAVGLWNGADPILKERLFGRSNGEGSLPTQTPTASIRLEPIRKENMETGPRKFLSWVLILLLGLPWSSLEAAEGAQTFKPEESEQMVAPIALYPDSLVSQILMASTYPLEVVQADRWLRQNTTLKGDALAAALEKQDWDPSVRSLVNFPPVLSMMSEKLDLTQKLGDAFLAQQKDVLDAVQRLRAKAQSTGNLQTTQEQKVIVEETIIKIEPANPQVVYVPQYNPTVVYGAWPYPAYPAYPWYPPGYAATAAFAFMGGVALGAAWGYAWGGCNWGRGDVDIDIDRNTNFNTSINRNEFKQNLEAKGIIRDGKGSW